MTARRALIDLMERALAGKKVEVNELFAAAPDAAASEIERLAWQRASHWMDDGDIRARDEGYAAVQRQQLTDALSDLEAFEAGYDVLEITRGEHQASHISGWGCLALSVLIAALAYAIYSYQIFTHS